VVAQIMRIVAMTVGSLLALADPAAAARLRRLRPAILRIDDLSIVCRHRIL
jgi:hypothetical protein